MLSRLWKKLTLTIAGALLVLGGAGATHKIIKNDSPDSTQGPTLVQIEYVIDGDTVKIEDDQRVRLLGIDAPEKGECFYAEATDFLKAQLDDREVKLEKDITEKDKYDRLLRYVILEPEEQGSDNVLINDLLVRQGFAKSISSPPDKRYHDLLSSAQEEAKRERRGLWSACTAEDEKVKALREEDSQPQDPECTIKGNISEKGYGKTYLIQGCDNYNTVKIDPRKGEAYFCTEQEAVSAGFRKATNCP